MTAYELACDIINKNNVQPCKFSPRGPLADAVQRFMGRAAGHEVFISEAQSNLFTTLLAGKMIITNGTTEADKFAAFVKPIWSAAKKQNYYLLTFCGVVAGDEPASAPTASPVTLAGQKAASADRAHKFAAVLIQGAIEKGYAKKDDRAKPGEDDYLCVWLTKAQADALMGMLECVPTAINAAGLIMSQPVGSFCYWSKARSATGSLLLCWMGEVADMPTAPVSTLPPGKLIPMDMDIPF